VRDGRRLIDCWRCGASAGGASSRLQGTPYGAPRPPAFARTGRHSGRCGAAIVQSAACSQPAVPAADAGRQRCRTNASFVMPRAALAFMRRLFAAAAFSAIFASMRFAMHRLNKEEGARWTARRCPLRRHYVVRRYALPSAPVVNMLFHGSVSRRITAPVFPTARDAARRGGDAMVCRCRDVYVALSPPYGFKVLPLAFSTERAKERSDVQEFTLYPRPAVYSGGAVPRWREERRSTTGETVARRLPLPPLPQSAVQLVESRQSLRV